jgi:hypothetical protein
VKAAIGSYGRRACVAADVRNVDDVSSRTEPSCGDLATASAPITPAAPALFSTMTVACRRCASGTAIARATASLLAPGENGTMILISFGSAVCAAAIAGRPSSTVAHTARRTIRTRMQSPCDT